MTPRSTTFVAFCASALLALPLVPAQTQTVGSIGSIGAPAAATTTTTAMATADAGQPPADARSSETTTQRLDPARAQWPTTNVLSESPRTLVPSFAQIFRDTGRDFTRLPSLQNGLILGLGAGLAGLSHPSDQHLSDEFNEATQANAFFGPGATLGQGYVQIGASLATYAIGRASGNSRLAIVGADLVRAQLIAEGTTQAAKLLAGRTRPNGERGSFPSGHTATSFATATVLQRHYGWKVGLPAYAFASYVGASRIQIKKHYLSDVAFGAALGIVAGRTVTMGIGGTKFALTPMSAPNGGIGVGLTRVPKR